MTCVMLLYSLLLIVVPKEVFSDNSKGSLVPTTDRNVPISNISPIVLAANASSFLKVEKQQPLSVYSQKNGHKKEKNPPSSGRNHQEGSLQELRTSSSTILPSTSSVAAASAEELLSSSPISSSTAPTKGKEQHLNLS